MLTPRFRLPIRSRPRDVFRVLQDFNNYPAWNPCIRICGNPRQGEVIEIKPRRPFTPWTSTRYEITGLQVGSEISWREVSKLDRLIYTRREILVYTTSEGATIFSSKLYLHGLLANIAVFFYRRQLADNLRREALALKSYCEQHYPLR